VVRADILSVLRCRDTGRQRDGDPRRGGAAGAARVLRGAAMSGRGGSCPRHAGARVGDARRAEALPRGFTLLLACLACLLLAPTPGDVGGCGQAPQELDAPIFFAT